MIRPPSAKPRRRGTERRAAILKAARAVFLQRGFSGASTDAIVERSGGSKETIYAHFGTKLGLFREVLLAEVNRSFEPTWELSEPDPGAMLRAVGRSFVHGFLDTDGLRLGRVMIAEVERVPDLGAQRMDSGIVRWKAMVGERLQAFQRAELIGPGDALELASTYCDLLAGRFIMPALFEPNVDRRPDTIDPQIDGCAALILDLFAPVTNGAAKRAPKRNLRSAGR